MPVRPKYPEDRAATRPTRQVGPSKKTPPTEGSKTQRRKANLASHKGTCHRN